MRKLKKVLCFTIIVSMLGMTACGTTSDEAKDNDSATEAVETQEETEAEAQETTGDVADTEMEDTGTSEETESSSGYYINLDKIRDEIAAIDINGRVDDHTLFMRTGERLTKNLRRNSAMTT